MSKTGISRYRFDKKKYMYNRLVVCKWVTKWDNHGRGTAASSLNKCCNLLFSWQSDTYVIDKTGRSLHCTVANVSAEYATEGLSMAHDFRTTSYSFDVAVCSLTYILFLQTSISKCTIYRNIYWNWYWKVRVSFFAIYIHSNEIHNVAALIVY